MFLLADFILCSSSFNVLGCVLRYAHQSNIFTRTSYFEVYACVYEDLKTDLWKILLPKCTPKKDLFDQCDSFCAHISQFQTYSVNETPTRPDAVGEQHLGVEPVSERTDLTQVRRSRDDQLLLLVRIPNLRSKARPQLNVVHRWLCMERGPTSPSGQNTSSRNNIAKERKPPM